MRDYARRWLPGVVPESAEPERCLYTTTPTTDFVLDRVGPVVVAAGFSGHGFKFAPRIGQLLADMADGSVASAPRFHLRRPAT
jgi:sarcosine oxidase